MPRTIWEWLEIEETRDQAAIKRAYALQAKKYHPEDSPEEAQQLRAAYKQALAFAGGKTGSAGFHPETGPESRAKVRREASGGGRAGTGGYRYDRYSDESREEPLCSESKSEEEYRYPPYHDRTREEQSERGQESAGEEYQYDLPPEEDEEGRLRRLDERLKEQRLRQLEESLKELRQKGRHQNPELWSLAVKGHLIEEDLKDPHVITMVISVLAQMPELDFPVWDMLERELFCHCDESMEWIWLKAQFAQTRKGDSVFSEKRKNDSFVRKNSLKEGEALLEKSNAGIELSYPKFLIIVGVIVQVVIFGILFAAKYL